jgi:hypothetical protein
LLPKDEVVLNIEGMSGILGRKPTAQREEDRNILSIRDSGSFIESDLSEPASKTEHKNLRRCTVFDVSFWTDHVDNAPVNSCAWVLQERILAPRVLHFCYDQVAWECGEFDAAEG